MTLADRPLILPVVPLAPPTNLLFSFDSLRPWLTPVRPINERYGELDLHHQRMGAFELF